METDLPEPVAPAISRCGILPRLPKLQPPDTLLPKATNSDFSERVNSSAEKSVAKPTMVLVLLGISIPTSDRPGIGASILIGWAAKARAKSLPRAVILESFTPSAGLKVYWV